MFCCQSQINRSNNVKFIYKYDLIYIKKLSYTVILFQHFYEVTFVTFNRDFNIQRTFLINFSVFRILLEVTCSMNFSAKRLENKKSDTLTMQIYHSMIGTMSMKIS